MGLGLMLLAVPLMLFSGLVLDGLSNDDGDLMAQDSDTQDTMVGDVPQNDEPPLI